MKTLIDIFYYLKMFKSIKKKKKKKKKKKI